MATTQYIGARYVPIFADPVEWNAERTYEPLTIVLHDGNSYTSRQFVPQGVDIDNDGFWALTGNYNAQVELYRQDVVRYAVQLNDVSATLNAEVTRATAAENELNSKIDAAKTNIFESIGKWNTFATVADMMNYDVKNNSVYFVQGRWKYGKGAGFYKVSDNLTENGYDIVACKNGLFAKLIPFDFVTPEQLEPESVTDWGPVLTYAVKFARDNGIKLYAGNSYTTLTPIIFTENGISVDIAGTVYYLGEGYAIDIRNQTSTYKFGTVSAPNGTAIALNQTENSYEDNVQSISVEYDIIAAKKDGVLLYAGNHGVLDIELKCNISNTAANCYHSIGGTSHEVDKPSYVGEVHITGGRMNGTDNGFLVEVGNGTECTGHKIHNLSAEGCGKLITLKADNGLISTVTVKSVRVGEISNHPGVITITGNVRSCEFWFTHLIYLAALNINTTAIESRGVYIYAPLNASGGSYTFYNAIQFFNSGYKLLNMTGIHESGLNSSTTWNLKSANIPVNFITSANGDIDLNNLTQFTNNGIPLYVNHSKAGNIKSGDTVLLDKSTDAPGIYALIKTDKNIKVLKMAK